MTHAANGHAVAVHTCDVTHEDISSIPHGRSIGTYCRCVGAANHTDTIVTIGDVRVLNTLIKTSGEVDSCVSTRQAVGVSDTGRVVGRHTATRTTGVLTIRVGRRLRRFNPDISHAHAVTRFKKYVVTVWQFVVG